MLDMKLHKHFKDINTKLTAIEKRIVRVATRLDNNLQKELAKGVDGMVDYELDCVIGFFRKDSDGDPFFELYEKLKGISGEDKESHSYFLADEINHNEFTSWKNHPMKGEFHCWLFHSLYDHIHSWEDIASIDTVWIDIRPRYQYAIDFNF